MSKIHKNTFQLTSKSPAISIRSKIWLEVDGKRLIGEGRAQLLNLIANHGSINAASKEMGISYRKAWSIVKDMEDVLGDELVSKHRGGAGGACLAGLPQAAGGGSVP